MTHSPSPLRGVHRRPDANHSGSLRPRDPRGEEALRGRREALASMVPHRVRSHNRHIVLLALLGGVSFFFPSPLLPLPHLLLQREAHPAPFSPQHARRVDPNVRLDDRHPPKCPGPSLLPLPSSLFCRPLLVTNAPPTTQVLFWVFFLFEVAAYTLSVGNDFLRYLEAWRVGFTPYYEALPAEKEKEGGGGRRPSSLRRDGAFDAGWGGAARWMVVTLLCT